MSQPQVSQMWLCIQVILTGIQVRGLLQRIPGPGADDAGSDQEQYIRMAS